MRWLYVHNPYGHEGRHILLRDWSAAVISSDMADVARCLARNDVTSLGYLHRGKVRPILAGWIAAGESLDERLARPP